MFRKVQLYNEPIKIFEKVPQYQKYCEMSEFEQGFLCAMLKKTNPKKVVEIGLAAGGTTAVIMNCLSLMDTETEMYSLDLSDRYYRDAEKDVAFVAKELKHYMNPKLKHTFLTGKYAPEFIDEIGGGIDFLIIDTVHSLPGEILDFLAYFPYLSPNAMVVLHDLTYNMTGLYHGYATKVLFDTVVADKYITEDADKIAGFANIGAFRITEDTNKYIANVFSALTITWAYRLSVNEIDIYRNCISKNYSKEIADIFNKAVEMQNYLACRICKDDEQKRELFGFLEKWKVAKHVIIYGCGIFGRKFLQLANDRGLKVDCFAISDGRNIPAETIDNIPVYNISDVPLKPENCLVIITTEASAWAMITEELNKRGYKTVY